MRSSLAWRSVSTAGVESPVPITLYTKPEDVLSADEWSSEIVDESFHIIHGVVRYNSGEELNSVLLASEEGINIFSYGWKMATKISWLNP
jgi:hypothetical protein